VATALLPLRDAAQAFMQKHERCPIGWTRNVGHFERQACNDKVVHLPDASGGDRLMLSST
jgi:hypothetical protein